LPEKIITVENCGCRSFSTIPGTEYWIDYQEIKIQEPFQTIKPGKIPKTLWIALEGCLVN
jgi:DNA replicative helicase MCM subunit Mcm2 (Cdc46/Mcm family)